MVSRWSHGLSWSTHTLRVSPAVLHAASSAGGRAVEHMHAEARGIVHFPRSEDWTFGRGAETKGHKGTQHAFDPVLVWMGANLLVRSRLS